MLSPNRSQRHRPGGAQASPRARLPHRGHLSGGGRSRARPASTTGKTIARANTVRLWGPQREREREDDARWHECVRASCPEGRPAEPLPPERRMGARRSGLGKTEARHETNSNLDSVLKARSAVDGRTEGWGMRPPGPRERSRNIWGDNGVCRCLCSFFVLNCFGLKVKHKRRTKLFECSGDRRPKPRGIPPLPQQRRDQAAQKTPESADHVRSCNRCDSPALPLKTGLIYTLLSLSCRRLDRAPINRSRNACPPLNY